MVETSNASGFPPLLSSTASLPYGVRARGMTLVSEILVCLLLLAAAGAVLGAAATSRGSESSLQAGAVLVFAAALGACGFAIWRAFTPWMILYPDRLERRSLTGWRTLNRADMEGMRTGSDRGGRWFEIISRLPGDPPIRVRQSVRDDPVVDRWFSGLVDITAAEIAADRAAILADPRYGATTAERESRLKIATYAARGAMGLGIAVGAWLIFMPPTPLVSLAVALAAPLVVAVIVQASNGLIIWFGRATAHPTIGFAAAPLAAAAFRAAVDTHLINYLPLFWAAGAIAVATCGLVYLRFHLPTGQVYAAGVLSAFVAFGLVILLDTAPDTSTPRVFPVTVQDKHVSHGRSTSYYLSVGAWSDQRGGDISVPASVYDATPVGSAICLNRHPGALDLGWYSVTGCPAGVEPAPGQTAPQATGPSFYPEAAQRAAMGGSAKVECAVVNDARLANCIVLAETPPGYGFGDAATRRLTSPDAGLDPSQLKGRTNIVTTVRFRMQP